MRAKDWFDRVPEPVLDDLVVRALKNSLFREKNSQRQWFKQPEYSGRRPDLVCFAGGQRRGVHLFEVKKAPLKKQDEVSLFNQVQENRYAADWSWGVVLRREVDRGVRKSRPDEFPGGLVDVYVSDDAEMEVVVRQEPPAPKADRQVNQITGWAVKMLHDQLDQVAEATQHTGPFKAPRLLESVYGREEDDILEDCGACGTPLPGEDEDEEATVESREMFAVRLPPDLIEHLHPWRDQRQTTQLIENYLQAVRAVDLPPGSVPTQEDLEEALHQVMRSKARREEYEVVS